MVTDEDIKNAINSGNLELAKELVLRQIDEANSDVQEVENVETVEAPKQTKKKRGRPKKTKKVSKPPKSVIPEDVFDDENDQNDGPIRPVKRRKQPDLYGNDDYDREDRVLARPMGPVKFVKNKWKDNGILTEQEKQERQKLYPVAPSKRDREPSTKINVYCGGCGRKKNIYPSEYIVGPEGDYLCNNCIGRRR